jgi:hypothetical protein
MTPGSRRPRSAETPFEVSVLRELERTLAAQQAPDVRILGIVRQLIIEAEAEDRLPRGGGPHD